MQEGGGSSGVGEAIEVDGFELHGLTEGDVVGLLQELLDVWVYLLLLALLLLLIVGFISSIAFPSTLLLLVEVIILRDIAIETLDTDTKLSTFHSSFKADTVLLLAL